MEMRDETSRAKSASGDTGMIVAPHAQAAEAGADVLRGGGTAIEALVAAGAALCVLYPHFCGLGGDAVWMLSEPGGQVSSLLGIGQAARRLDGIEAIPARGPGSALTTACLVDSWDRLLEVSRDKWGGTRTLAGLLDPAIQLAEDGFDVSASQAFWFDLRAGECGAWPGFEGVFRADGRQRQPDLGRTLRRIADHGARDFYEGDLARRIASALEALGSPLDLEDLRRTRARFADPISLRYRDVTLFAPPPPTQGMTTLGIMGILAEVDIGALEAGGADHYHWLVEAVKQAFLDRHLIGDPDPLPDGALDRLLDPQHLSAKARVIRREQALAWPHVYEQGDTAFLAAVDAAGRCACVLQSIYFDWGSGVVAGDTGILWQNRGAAFSVDPSSPNRLLPGRRPFYTLNPGIAIKDGRPSLLYGTQGADGQPQTLSLLLSLLIDHGLDPSDALSRARFLLGKTFSDSRESLKLESNAGSGVFAELAKRGHVVSQIDTLSPLGGQAGVIRIDADGLLVGAHDPRSDGAAIGL